VLRELGRLGIDLERMPHELETEASRHAAQAFTELGHWLEASQR